MSKKLYVCHATVVWYAYTDSFEEAMSQCDKALKDDCPPISEKGGRLIESAPYEIEECWEPQDIVYTTDDHGPSLGSCLSDLPRFESKWKYWEG